MIENASGIILRVRPLTETSLIIHWLTTDSGRVATVAKGARRPKSPFAGKLDLFYLGRFSFSRSAKSDLHTLREVELQETHSALRLDVLKLQQAAYATALIELATETDTPLPEFFDLTREFLAALCSHPAHPQTVFAFELKLLQLLGLEPDLDQLKLNPGTKKIIQLLLSGTWENSGQLKLTEPQNREVAGFLQHFLLTYLERVPHGRASALNI
jgi:DNA repair protein RecO (recombination protein O)